MAKKPKSDGINKAQAIREYVTEHPDEGPKAVADILTKQLGVEVTPGTVSTTKYQMGRVAAEGNSKPAQPTIDTPKRGRPASTSQATNGARGGSATKIGIEELLAAKALSDKLGGVEKAKEALELLAKLR